MYIYGGSTFMGYIYDILHVIRVPIGGYLVINTVNTVIMDVRVFYGYEALFGSPSLS